MAGGQHPSRQQTNSTDMTKHLLIALAALAGTMMLRWRIERDYEKLNDELGLDTYEGRG